MRARSRAHVTLRQIIGALLQTKALRTLKKYAKPRWPLGGSVRMYLCRVRLCVLVLCFAAWPCTWESVHAWSWVCTCQMRACVLGRGRGCVRACVWGTHSSFKTHDALVRRDSQRPRSLSTSSPTQRQPKQGLMAGRTLRKRLVSLGRRNRTEDASPDMQRWVQRDCG